jgi:glutathione S-transferase
MTSKTPVATDGLSLYQTTTCWFCGKVRQKIKDLGISIELRDIAASTGYRDELIQGGGMGQVPCLRIAQLDGRVDWLYESSDICEYLQEKFA